jgi:hypothetical protein
MNLVVAFLSKMIFTNASMSMKTMIALLTSMSLIQQACDRKPHPSPESSVLENSGIQALFINDHERFFLDGKLDRLTISYQVKEADHWAERSHCIVERLKEDDEISMNEQNTQQEGNIYTYESNNGNVGYHAAAFYHQTSGLLIYQMRCDHPGSLNAKATLAGGTVTGRTEIQTSNEHIRTGVLFIPFEAEVTPASNSLIIRGEGELVLVMAIEDSNDQQAGIAAKWQQACIKYDPTSNGHYDVIKVTNAMRSECEIPSRNP